MLQASTCSLELTQGLTPSSLVDEAWYLLTAVLNEVFSIDLKRVETLHSLFWDFWTDKTFTTVGQTAEFKFESKF